MKREVLLVGLQMRDVFRYTSFNSSFPFVKGMWLSFSKDFRTIYPGLQFYLCFLLATLFSNHRIRRFSPGCWRCSPRICPWNDHKMWITFIRALTIIVIIGKPAIGQSAARPVIEHCAAYLMAKSSYRALCLLFIRDAAASNWGRPFGLSNSL